MRLVKFFTGLLILYLAIVVPYIFDHYGKIYMFLHVNAYTFMSDSSSILSEKLGNIHRVIFDIPNTRKATISEEFQSSRVEKMKKTK